MTNEELLESARAWLKDSVFNTAATDGQAAALQSLAASTLILARLAAAQLEGYDRKAARRQRLADLANRADATDGFQRKVAEATFDTVGTAWDKED